MRLSDETIQQVREAIDIAELVGSYVDLKPSGKQMKACCPFHQEKTPSFFVTPEWGTYKCFGCGESGDGISFVMKMEHLDFMEAVRYLAERYHIPLVESDPKESFRQARREKYYKINAETARFYYKNLLTNERALQYLAHRGFKAQIINDFFLGYADGRGDSLYRYLTEKGYEAQDLLTLGLIARSNRGTGYYDKFRDRLMFPILSVQEKVIGFGGRAIGDRKPKYLNSPDSEIFHKGEHLYHLFQVRKESHDREIILVEGYMDVASLSYHGVTNAVASLGTSLTENQAKLVKRYADRVYLCYDGDSAGIRAARRAIDVFGKADISPKLVVLPEGKDPDDVAKTEGAEAFRHYCSLAMDPLDFELQLLEAGFDLDDSGGRMDFLTRALDFLAAIEQETMRDVMAQQVAEAAKVSVEGVKHDAKERRQVLLSREKEKSVSSFGKSGTSGKQAEDVPPTSYYFEAEQEEDVPEDFDPAPSYLNADSPDASLGMYATSGLAVERFRLEREMVRLIRQNTECDDVLKEEQDFIENPGLQQLLHIIRHLRNAGISPQKDWIRESECSQEARDIAEWMDHVSAPASHDMAQELLARIRRFRLREQKARILDVLDHPEQNEPQTSRSTLLTQLQEIEKRLRASGGGLT